VAPPQRRKPLIRKASTKVAKIPNKNTEKRSSNIIQRQIIMEINKDQFRPSTSQDTSLNVVIGEVENCEDPKKNPNAVSMDMETIVSCNTSTSQEFPPLPQTIDADGFTEPKNKRNRYGHPAMAATRPIQRTNPNIHVSPIPLSNRYSILSDQPKINSNQATENKPKIPPIYICEASDFQSVLADLRTQTSSEFHLKQCHKKIKLQLTNIDDYRLVTKFYNDNNVKYFSFNNPTEKKLSIIIRGVPYGLTDQDIKDELAKSFPILKVTRLNNRQGHPTPLISVLVEDTDEGKNIFSMHTLFCFVVKVEERRKSKQVSQCTNCQQIGHSKNYCHLDAKCNKCAGNHASKNCPQNDDHISKCVNCGGDHKAIYRGCNAFKIFKEIRKTGSINKNSIKTPPPNGQPIVNLASTSQDTEFSRRLKPTREAQKNNPWFNKSQPSQQGKDDTSHQFNRSQSSKNDDSFYSSLSEFIFNLIKPLIPLVKPFLTQLVAQVFEYGSK